MCIFYMAIGKMFVCLVNNQTNNNKCTHSYCCCAGHIIYDNNLFYIDCL